MPRRDEIASIWMRARREARVEVAAARRSRHDGRLVADVDTVPRPLSDEDDARAFIRRCRNRIEAEVDDPGAVQDLLLVLLWSHAQREYDPDPGSGLGPRTRPARWMRRYDRMVARGLDSLRRRTREPWTCVEVSPEAALELDVALAGRSLRATRSVPAAAAIWRALFSEVAGPDGTLLPGSQFARPQSSERLLDAFGFHSRSERDHVIAAAAARAFGQPDRPRERNVDFLRGNHKRGDLELSNYPKLIHVELATVCNLRCRTCSTTRPERSRPEDFIRLETVERLRPALPFISDAKLHGGGEPFLHPQIEPVLQVFEDEGVRLHTVTNATLVTERLARIIGRSFSTLSVSVDGADQATYEYVRVRGRWDKLVRGLDHINRHRGPDLKLLIAVVLMRCNIEQLPDLVRFAHEHGAQELQAGWLRPFDTLPWTHEQGLEQDPVRANELLAESLAVGAELGVTVRLPGVLPTPGDGTAVRLTHKPTDLDLHGTSRVEGHCRLMYDRALIQVDGQVQPCGQSLEVPELGSIHRQSFHDIWNGPGYQQLRATFNEGTLPPTCRGCNFIRSNQIGAARLVYESADGTERDD